MPFADPQACPDCRGRIDGQPACPHCGLDLTSAEVREVWRLLLQADELVDRAARARDAARAASAAAVTVPPVPGPAPLAPPPPVPPPPGSYPVQPGPPGTPRRRLSAGSVLLGLGAFGMVVAAFIFLTVSWGALGVAGRALVLLAFTAAVGAAAAWATARPLRGSAESLWGLFLVMATLDWFVACDQGLLGLDGLGDRATALVWAAAVVPLGTTVAQRARRPLGAVLVVPMLVVGAGVAVAAATTAFELDARGASPFWAVLAAAAVAGASAAALARLRHTVSAVVAGVVAAATATGSAVLAVVDLVEHPAAGEVVGGGHGVPLVVVMLSLVVLGTVLPQVSPAAAVAAGAALVLLVSVPVEHAAPGRGAVLVVAASAVAGAVLLAGAGPWRAGGRTLSAALAGGLALGGLGWAADTLDAMTGGVTSPRTLPLDARPDGLPGPWWLVVAVGAALAAALLAVRRWPGADGVRPALVPAAWVVAAGAADLAVAAAEPPYVVTAAVVLATGAVLTVPLSRHPVGWQLVPPAGVALGLWAGLTHDGASVALWGAGSLVLAVQSWRQAQRVLRDALAAAAAGMAVVALSFALDVLGATTTGFAVAYVLAAAALAVAARVLRDGRGVPVEAVAAVTAVVGLVLASGLDEPGVRAAVFGLAAGLAVLLAAVSEGERVRVQRVVAASTGLGALAVGLPDADVGVVAWSATTALLAGLSWWGSTTAERRVMAFLASLVGAGAIGFAFEVLDASAEASTLALVVVAGVLAAAAPVLRGGRDVAVEAATALVLLVALAVAGGDTSVAWQALLWTVSGAVAVIVGLVGPARWSPRRLVYRGAGSAALSVAYVLRLVASDVGVVEAYTLPFALVLLAAGAWSMRGTAAPPSVLALGPGLTLLLLPSLPQALADPTGPRALLLGLAALLVLVVGVVRNLQAPFVLGALVLLLLLVVNVGPYAFAVPRWTVIAAASALLLGAGITWEDRVRDGRAAVRWVARMA